MHHLAQFMEIQKNPMNMEKSHETLSVLQTSGVIINRFLNPLSQNDKIVENVFFHKKIQRQKMKNCNRLKRVLPKFRTDPTFVRGVNGRSKF